jgi:hypothetical protein
MESIQSVARLSMLEANATIGGDSSADHTTRT